MVYRLREVRVLNNSYFFCIFYELTQISLYNINIKYKLVQNIKQIKNMKQKNELIKIYLYNINIKIN